MMCILVTGTDQGTADKTSVKGNRVQIGVKTDADIGGIIGLFIGDA